MSATVAAALKKIAVYILTDKKALKVVGGIVLGIIIIIIMPIVAVVSIFNGDINIDTDRLQTMVVENLSAEEKAKLQFVVDTMYAIEDEMTAAGFDDQRVKEAQVLYVLALSDYAAEDGFVSKLVGCFNGLWRCCSIGAVLAEFSCADSYSMCNILRNIRSAMEQLLIPHSLSCRSCQPACRQQERLFCRSRCRPHPQA